MTDTRRPASRGFTLVELLVCAALSAILLSLAVPSYRHSVLKARRQDARAALVHLQTLQERYYFDRGRYAAALDELSPGQGDHTEGGFYSLQIRAAADGQSYQLAALPLADQSADVDCQRLTLDEAGRRGAAGGPAADQLCWR